MPKGAVKAGRSSLESLASVVQRLGVLLAAGVAPTSGWRYVAEGAEQSIAARVARIATSADVGESISDAILNATDDSDLQRRAWCGLAAAWSVATESGAPLATTLDSFAQSLRALAQNQRDLETALAGPVATARMVMILPGVGVLFGGALGFNTVGVLFTTPIGIGCLLAGIALMLVARWWNRRLISTARPRDLTPGLELDLLAIAVSGGASISRARNTVATACAKFQLSVGDPVASGAVAVGQPLESSEATAIIDLSRRAGVPAAALLRSEAVEQRRVARSAADSTAAKLSVTLMLPLGVCILPAFMLLGVAPLLIAVISSTVETFE